MSGLNDFQQLDSLTQMTFAGIFSLAGCIPAVVAFM